MGGWWQAWGPGAVAVAGLVLVRAGGEEEVQGCWSRHASIKGWPAPHPRPLQPISDGLHERFCTFGGHALPCPDRGECFPHSVPTHTNVVSHIGAPLMVIWDQHRII